MMRGQVIFSPVIMAILVTLGVLIIVFLIISGRLENLPYLNLGG